MTDYRKWKHLSIFPESSAPYYYDMAYLEQNPGLLIKLINNWMSQGINVTITLTKTFDSPLCGQYYFCIFLIDRYFKYCAYGYICGEQYCGKS